MGDPAFVTRAAGSSGEQLAQAVMEHVLQQPGGLTLPVSFLVDPHGDIQMVYLGAVSPAALGTDVRQFLDRQIQGAQRSVYGGRWYYRTSRDLLGLSWELKRLGLREDARHYLAIHELGTSQKNGAE
jgi:hypothetical protein